MKPNEADKLEKEDSQHASRLDRERTGIRIMKFMLALFSIILVIATVLSMLLNR